MQKRTLRQMVAEAHQQIENLSPVQLVAEVRDRQTLLLDIREAGELLQRGVIQGAVSAPRGLLEFYADADSHYYWPAFQPDRRIILYCTSGERSALAAVALQQLGYTNIAHLAGGLGGWQQANLPVVSALRWPSRPA